MLTAKWVVGDASLLSRKGDTSWDIRKVNISTLCVYIDMMKELVNETSPFSLGPKAFQMSLSIL